MPWKYNNRTIRAGKAWTDDNGIKHPNVWMRWSDAEKKAAGLVWEDPPASEAAFDNRFYHGRQTDGTLIPKSLTDVNEVDEDGKALLDIDGKQIVTLGLKSVAIAQAKTEAAGLLAPYDWYVTRKAEDSTAAIPAAVSTYRSAVRTTCGTRETEINACTTTDELAALLTNPAEVLDSEGNMVANTESFITRWPDRLS